MYPSSIKGWVFPFWLEDLPDFRLLPIHREGWPLFAAPEGWLIYAAHASKAWTIPSCQGSWRTGSVWALNRPLYSPSPSFLSRVCGDQDLGMESVLHKANPCVQCSDLWCWWPRVPQAELWRNYSLFKCFEVLLRFSWTQRGPTCYSSQDLPGVVLSLDLPRKKWKTLQERDPQKNQFVQGFLLIELEWGEKCDDGSLRNLDVAVPTWSPLRWLFWTPAMTQLTD